MLVVVGPLRCLITGPPGGSWVVVVPLRGCPSCAVVFAVSARGRQSLGLPVVGTGVGRGLYRLHQVVY